MTLAEMKNHIMFQTNNDTDDIGDYTPYILDYINEGYDRLVKVWTNKYHLPTEDYPKLALDTDTPNLPDWLHRPICDWATWLIYRNGNPQKQQRGRAYYEAFMMILSQIAGEGGADGLNEDGSVKQYKYFRNIPR